MTTVASPVSWSQLSTNEGQTVFDQAIVLARQNQPRNIIDLGLVDFAGNMAGMGTDTLKTTFRSDWGAANSLTAAGSETAVAPLVSFTDGQYSISFAEYLAGIQTTYKSAVIEQPGAAQLMTFGSLADGFMKMWMNKLQGLLMTAGAAISNAPSIPSGRFSVDHLEAIADAIAADNGARDYSGDFVLVLHPTSARYLGHSIRAEPAFQGSPESWSTALTMGLSDRVAALGLPFTIVVSPAVVTSGGNHKNFLYQRGAFRYCVASPDAIDVRVDHIKIPEYGALIQRPTDRASAGVNAFEMRSWFGLSATDESVQYRATLPTSAT